VGAGGMGRAGKCGQRGLCEYIQWDGRWWLEQRSDSSLLNRHALVGRGSLVPPSSEYTSESNIPYSGCFVKWFVNTPRFLFDSRCFWISTLQQVCRHWLVSTTCRAGCSSSCEGIAGTSNASGQNTKWRNQQDPIPKRQHNPALVVCHTTLDAILNLFADDKDLASLISAHYIGFVIPGLGIATNIPFVAVAGDTLFCCTDVL
jgi:hypothetical protein